MISEKEIEEAAKRIYGDNVGLGYSWAFASFQLGAKWMQEKIMSEASEGFQEWFDNTIFERAHDLQRSAAKEAWQAAKISNMKEVEELKQRLAEAEKVIGFYADKSNYVGRRAGSDTFTNIKGDNEIWQDRTGHGGKRAREYQKKHGVNK